MTPKKPNPNWPYMPPPEFIHEDWLHEEVEDQIAELDIPNTEDE